jgi:hypothetical protein
MIAYEDICGLFVYEYELELMLEFRDGRIMCYDCIYT